MLDAPDLRDDFYLHLLDWSKNNHMAVALHDTLFVWNAADGSIDELYCKESEEEYISCVSWVVSIYHNHKYFINQLCENNSGNYVVIL